MPVTSLLAPLLSRITAVLYPPSCALCQADTGAPHALCPSCWSEIAFIARGGCTRCGRPLPGPVIFDELVICEDCLAHPPLWQRGASVFRYEGAGRRLVLALKHGDRLDLAPMLAGWAQRSGADLIAQADLVAPVPLHWSRRLKRRTNHAAELARHIVSGRTIGPVFAPRLLVRARRTQSQDGRNRLARAANLAGAIAPGPGPAMAGCRVLLVDDVMTTGATLNESTRVCLEAGAAAVDILVLALVMRDETAYMRAPEEDDDDEAG